MSEQHDQVLWTQPGWLDEARDWIGAQLDRQGIRSSGPIEQVHVRPWSTVLRVPASAGNLYFKASAPVLVHELALTQALAQWRPDCILPLLAAAPERGWMLMPDGGALLRTAIGAERDVRRWEEVLPLYAELQLDLASRCDAMLALGTPERRLITLPAQLAMVLEDSESLRADKADGLTHDEIDRIRQLVPDVTEACDRLTGYGIPESLNHGDLHDGNIFMYDDRYLFFDWGDAGLAHPFFSLRTTVVSVEISLGLEEGAAPLDRLRDAYLEPWTRLLPRQALNDAFTLAQRLWAIGSILSWHRMVSSLEGSWREEYAYAVPGLLQELLQEFPEKRSP